MGLEEGVHFWTLQFQWFFVGGISSSPSFLLSPPFDHILVTWYDELL